MATTPSRDVDDPRARASVTPVAPPEGGAPLSAPPLQLARRSSGDQAAQYIRRLIWDGEIRPRTRVPQDDVARAMGISRIPVREALIALELEGWVTIELHRGAFVSQLDEPGVRDHYELFGLTYGLAVERALERSGDEFAGRLRTTNERFQAATDPGDIWQGAIDFHGVVVDAARSPRLRVALRTMPGIVPGNFFEEIPGSVDVERRGLAAVTAAVSTGDAAKAAAAYRAMLREQADAVVVVLTERGLFESS